MPESNSRIRELTISAFLQALGSLATLGTIAYLAHTQGPVVQGLFSSLKAEFEFFSAFLLFGIPQAVFYFVVSKKQEINQALTLTFIHGILAFSVIGIWVSTTMYGEHPNFGSRHDALLFSVAAAMGVIYANGRALVLAARSTVIFSLITALPAGLILAVVLFIGFFASQAESSNPLIASPIVFLITYAMAACVTFFSVQPVPRFSISWLPFGEVVKLSRYGIATWIPAISQAGGNLFAIRWIGQSLGLAEGVGAFATAFALVLAVLAPLNMVIPIFFKWWAPITGEQRKQEFTKILAATLIIAVISIAFIWLLERYIVAFMFGEEYQGFLGVYALMSTTILPQAIFRILGVYWNSSGRPNITASMEICRLVLIIVIILILATDLNSTVFAWVLADYVSLVIGGVMFFSTGPQFDR